jgi:hypothetical protein
MGNTRSNIRDFFSRVLSIPERNTSVHNVQKTKIYTSVPDTEEEHYLLVSSKTSIPDVCIIIST